MLTCLTDDFEALVTEGQRAAGLPSQFGFGFGDDGVVVVVFTDPDGNEAAVGCHLVLHFDFLFDVNLLSMSPPAQLAVLLRVD